MIRCFSLLIGAIMLVSVSYARAQAPDGDTKGKVCHMEQQCHWENFQKHCVWVKVCR
jgi:hypothetical protein